MMPQFCSLILITYGILSKNHPEIIANLLGSAHFRISYNLTGKWNFDIDFFQVLICCNISNSDLIKKCYQDNL